MTGFTRWRVPLGFAFAAWYLWVARPANGALLLFCGLLVAGGCALRSWAAGYLLKGKRVAVGGPYAYVRNPLYMGSFLIALGFCAVLWRRPLPISTVVLWSAFLVGFGVMYRAKILVEERELTRNLGEPYRTYVQRVPGFVPVRGRVPGLGEQRFSAEIYSRNREYQCLLGSAAILALLTVRLLYAF